MRFEAHGVSLVDQRSAAENVYRLALSLERNELRDVFEALCEDIILVASAGSTPPIAFANVTKRLAAWQSCLRIRKNGLSLEEQIGLLGELLVLQMIAEVAGYPTAVEAWKGPIDGIHDFVGPGLTIEVKSVLGIGTHLYISRLDQLESVGLSQLVIARLRFRQGPGGESLSGYVKNIRREISSRYPTALYPFEEKLLRAGYLDLDATLYEATLVSQENLCCYIVRDDFPRLIRQSIPSAIVDGSYTIEERAISGFRREGGEFRIMLQEWLESGHD
jgi:hypothetical protein